MKNPNHSKIGFSEATESLNFLKQTLRDKQALLSQLKPTSTAIERADLQLEIAEIMLEISENGMPEASWGLAKEAFILYMDNDQFEAAVNALDCLYRLN